MHGIAQRLGSGGHLWPFQEHEHGWLVQCFPLSSPFFPFLFYFVLDFSSKKEGGKLGWETKEEFLQGKRKSLESRHLMRKLIQLILVIALLFSLYPNSSGHGSRSHFPQAVSGWIWTHVTGHDNLILTLSAWEVHAVLVNKSMMTSGFIIVPDSIEPPLHLSHFLYIPPIFHGNTTVLPSKYLQPYLFQWQVSNFPFIYLKIILNLQHIKT